MFTKQLLERLMKEEREIYLEENPHTKGNGYYERNLLTDVTHIATFPTQS
jgi:hypothetical protein